MMAGRGPELASVRPIDDASLDSVTAECISSLDVRIAWSTWAGGEQDGIAARR